MEHLKIADAHAHIFPGAIAEKAKESVGNFYHLPMYTTGFPHTLIEEGSKIGVTRYLVCSAATTPEQVCSINDFIHRKCLQYPQFVGFATLHPHMEDPFAEIDRILQLGLRGVKFHSDLQQFYADDPIMLPIYRRLAQVGLPVLFHAGDSRYDYSQPRRIHNVAEAVPGLTCIASHFGGYQRWSEAELYLKLPNVYLDTSSSLYFLTKEDAREMIAYFGPEKFMFGTDFPMWDHTAELRRFLDLGLPEKDRDQILYKTFEQVLGVPV